MAVQIYILQYTTYSIPRSSVLASTSVVNMIEEFVLCSNSIFCGQNVQASNEWLVNLSQQDDSWKVFLPIIADCDYGEAALFFAVKLLHRYIQLRWNTLDPAEKSHIIEVHHNIVSYFPVLFSVHVVTGGETICCTEHSIH